jgi:GNAT superfamily N-acetyltransferase
MHIREAEQSDIPRILGVLKASLGETSSRKTEEIWRYKHISNPFGESLILVAEENNEIIGVRAFMRWIWQEGEKIYSAYRAVDTATHPEHQGKGIFKKLTLKALEIGQERGDHFVFNTPNAQSKPGYLKMGWEEVGKLKIHLVPVNPLYWGNKKPSSGNRVNLAEVDNSSMLDSWNTKLKNYGILFTPKNAAYLDWRYGFNPLQSYRILTEKDLFIAGYVKQQSRFRELRISELIFSPDISQRLIKKTIRTWAKEAGVHFISLQIPGDKSIFQRKISGNFGPVLTFKEVRKDLEKVDFLNLSSWEYSLGDLELF